MISITQACDRLRLWWSQALIRLQGYDTIKSHPGYKAWRQYPSHYIRGVGFAKPERIIASAQVDLQGTIWTVMAPGRHHHCIAYMAEHGVSNTTVPGNCSPDRQGFVTNRGRYVNRVEARALAIANGQAKQEQLHSRDLFSEDVWDTPEHLQYKG